MPWKPSGLPAGRPAMELGSASSTWMIYSEVFHARIDDLKLTDLSGDSSTGLIFSAGLVSIGSVTLGSNPLGYAIKNGACWSAIDAAATATGYELFWKTPALVNTPVGFSMPPATPSPAPSMDSVLATLPSGMRFSQEPLLPSPSPSQASLSPPPTQAQAGAPSQPHRPVPAMTSTGKTLSMGSSPAGISTATARTPAGGCSPISNSSMVSPASGLISLEMGSE